MFVVTLAVLFLLHSDCNLSSMYWKIITSRTLYFSYWILQDTLAIIIFYFQYGFEFSLCSTFSKKAKMNNQHQFWGNVWLPFCPIVGPVLTSFLNSGFDDTLFCQWENSCVHWMYCFRQSILTTAAVLFDLGMNADCSISHKKKDRC